MTRDPLKKDSQLAARRRQVSSASRSMEMRGGRSQLKRVKFIKNAAPDCTITAIQIGKDTFPLAETIVETEETYLNLTAGNTDVTITQTPVTTRVVKVHRNGYKQIEGQHYTVAGLVYTFIIPFGASGGATGDEDVQISYFYEV